MRMHAVVASLLASAFVSAAAHAQAPEMRGPLTTASWDAGSLTLDGTPIRTRAFYPETGGPYPLVGVIHGASADGSYHTELATVLASRGFVALTPDLPCEPTSCDHDANQRQITALLAWAVAQSSDASSPLHARVDGTRRGLIGHSWGGLSSHITAARDPSIDAVVLLDPNDDFTDGLSVTSAITAPHLTLLADVPGACNAAWQEAVVRTRLGGPRLDFTLDRSGHCDPGERDVLCSFGCGRGDSSTTALFRRYAVAWTACVLAGDPSMADWIGGASYEADRSSGTIEDAMGAMLDTLPCRAGGLPDAGALARSDAGPASALDVGPSSPTDAALEPMRDAASSATTDAPAARPDASRTPPTDPAGCACRAAHGVGSVRVSVLVAALALALAARRRTPPR